MYSFVKNIIFWLIINFYCRIYKIYIQLLSLALGVTGPIHFTYILRNDKFKNITLNYYTNLFLKNNSVGEFYFKTINRDCINYYMSFGHIHEVAHIVCSNVNKEKRKDALLLDKNKNTINLDLNVLDNFYSNIILLGNKVDPPLKKVLSFFGIDNCECVEFIQFIPFKKHNIDISDLKLSDLYLNTL